MRFALAAVLLGVSGLAAAQSPYSLGISRDLQANKSLALATIDTHVFHLPFGVWPRVSLTPQAFTATYIGDKGFGVGADLKFAVQFKGFEPYVLFGKGFFNVYRGDHNVLEIGLTIGRPTK